MARAIADAAPCLTWVPKRGHRALANVQPDSSAGPVTDIEQNVMPHVYQAWRQGQHIDGRPKSAHGWRWRARDPGVKARYGHRGPLNGSLMAERAPRSTLSS